MKCDFKYADLIFGDKSRTRISLPTGCDTLDDIALIRHYGWTPVALQGQHLMVAYQGFIWVVGYALEFDGEHMLEAVKSDIKYDDCFEVEDEIKITQGEAR